MTAYALKDSLPVNSRLPIVSDGLSHPSNQGRFGLLLALLLFFVPVCSLPPFRIGYYTQVESSLLCFWFVSALTCLWLSVLQSKYPRLFQRTSRLPLVWGPLSLGVFSLLISIFHALPFQDFVGAPQVGEGGLTLIGTGLIAALLSIITRISFYRTIIFRVALPIGLLIGILTSIGSWESPIVSMRYWTWASFFFPDFLSFIDIGFAGVYLYSRRDIKSRRVGTDVLALGIFVAIAYFASSKSLNYGLFIAGAIGASLYLMPKIWRQLSLQVIFFGLTISITLLLTFYDVVSQNLPDSLKSLGHISTLISRTWLSKVTIVDLWAKPLDWSWISQVFLGRGWGSFGNISLGNMFLIDQVSIFSDKNLGPTWEHMNRDLMHTHNIVTTLFHSLGLVGVCLYLYTQFKLINSLSSKYFIAGAGLLILYQIQVLFWFQFLMTIPFMMLALVLYFREPVKMPAYDPQKLVGKSALYIYASLLLLFVGLQGYVSWGYQGLKVSNVQSNKTLIDELTTAKYVSLEAYFGAPRQVGLARTYSLAANKEFESQPGDLVTYSMKLVDHLHALPKGANALATTLALNILSELATTPETLHHFSASTYKTWEELVRDQIRILPHRSDILIPFFNLYQSQDKDKIVLGFLDQLLSLNKGDPVALWFKGSSYLKNPDHFQEGMCLLKAALRKGIDRFMPISQEVKTKILEQAGHCPGERSEIPPSA